MLLATVSASAQTADAVVDDEAHPNATSVNTRVDTAEVQDWLAPYLALWVRHSHRGPVSPVLQSHR